MVLLEVFFSTMLSVYGGKQFNPFIAPVLKGSLCKAVLLKYPVTSISLSQ